MTALPLPATLGTALRVLPLAPLQPILAAILRAIVRRHPGIAERLGEHAAKKFAVEPSDLPFAFLLEPFVVGPRLTARRTIPRGAVDVRIAGPFTMLLGLLDGTYDGDALFFSRDITVEGDMEAVVALRNAIDDAGIDFIADIAASFGAAAPLVEGAGRPLAAGLRLLADARHPALKADPWS